jgi:hypothetical protein
MRFPKSAGDDEAAHTSAVRDLGEAREEQRRLSDRHSAAEGTSDEADASRRLSAGRARVAAREAWLTCVERIVSRRP